MANNNDDNIKKRNDYKKMIWFDFFLFFFQGYRGKGARPGTQTAQVSSVVNEMNSAPGLIVSFFLFSFDIWLF